MKHVTRMIYNKFVFIQDKVLLSQRKIMIISLELVDESEEIYDPVEVRKYVSFAAVVEFAYLIKHTMHDFLKFTNFSSYVFFICTSRHILFCNK